MKHGKTIITWLLLGTLCSSLLAAPALSAEAPVTEAEAQTESAQASAEYIAESADPAQASPENQLESQSEELPQSETSGGETSGEQSQEASESSHSQEPSAEQGGSNGAESERASEAVNGTENSASAEDAASESQDVEDFATETVVSSYSRPSVVDDSGWATNPSGSVTMTLREDDVSKSVAEAGYFPSKDDVLNGRVSGIFTASMILWHRNNGAGCYRIKDTTVFADAFGGTAQYTPRPGDLIYYQAYQDEYDAGVITSGNSNWLHVGIVAEVGEDYITTIEGNTSQRVSKLTLTRTHGVIGRYTDYRRSWIVDIFGNDDEARESYVATAWQAWVDAEADAQSGRYGFGTWRESRYNGVYQNDTIASGYFGMPAAWCEMFVLWCAFNADVVRTGMVTVAVSSQERPLLTVIAQGQSLGGYEFSFYPVAEDGDYSSAEPSFVITTDVNGMGESRDNAYGDYHVVQTGGEKLALEPFDFTLQDRDLCITMTIEPMQEQDTDGIVSALIDNLLSVEQAGRVYIQEMPENSYMPKGAHTLPSLDSATGRELIPENSAEQEASSAPVERAAKMLTPLRDVTSVLA